jgi:hypothetical protein
VAEPNAILSQEEKTAILLHLGYFAQSMSVGSISLGIPAASQPMFLVASAVERVPESAVGRIRLCLARLAVIEDALAKVVDQLNVDKVGDISMRSDAGDAIEHEYARWAARLANYLGVPLNPFAERYANSGPAPMSRPVIHA